MFKVILILAGVFAAGWAHASSDFTYQPATDGTYRCINYCMGFTTSDPSHTVEYVNVQLYSANLFRVTASVDGQGYSGLVADPTQLNQLVQTDIVNGFVVYGSKTILASAVYWHKHTCTHSGRGQHCTDWYFTTNGGVSL